MEHLFHPLKKSIGRLLLRFSREFKENHFQRKKLFLYLKKIHNLFPKFVFYTITTFFDICAQTF